MKPLYKILEKPITATMLSTMLGFMVAAVILALSGYDPVQAFGALFRGMFSRPKYISNVIIKSTPVIITGIAVAVAFKSGLFNIGAEGQYIVGTIAATITGYLLNLHPIIQIPIVISAAALAGALWGLITGFLKAKFGINEVITSIMLNWIAFYLANYFVNSNTFHDPNTSASYRVNKSSYTMIFPDWKTSPEGLQALKKIPWLYDMLVRTDVNIGFLVAVLLGFAIWFLLYRTTKGFELRAVGLNKNASQCCGINVNLNIMEAMLLSGGICGLAAALSITGMMPHRVSQLVVFESNGLNGLPVALIAGNSPIGCILSGLLFGGLIYGGQSVQSETGAPSEIIKIMIGTIVFFIALSTIIPMIIDMLKKKGEAND